MAIAIGGLVLDPAATAVEEELEESGGRDGRVFTLRGMLSGYASADAVETALDDLLGAVSLDDALVPFSLRAGRRFLVRRLEFVREVRRDSATGVFRLKLEAPSPFEESEAEYSALWSVSPQSLSLETSGGGTAPAPIVATITAGDTLVDPGLSDGTRSIVYAGTLILGQVLEFDGTSGRVTLDGADVTAYTQGRFPHIAPGANTLAFLDAPASSHLAEVSIRYRHRWW